MSASSLKVIETTVLPKNPLSTVIYRLLPHVFDSDFYNERTDRNIGWITKEEQALLYRSTIGIAGCGGMGGLLASIFCRLGIGEIRIADCETFDISNINRQFAAGRSSIGRSKAFETARLTRETIDDVTLVVYPQGITQETAAHFSRGCDLICDEIEFWAMGARILLHQAARASEVSVINCNTVGFGTRLFLFEPNGYTMEELLRLDYEEANRLQERIQARTASSEEVSRAMEHILAGLVPELPEYVTDSKLYSTAEVARSRLFNENRATIIATNPVLAAGFLANHALFQLLRSSSVPRRYVLPPQPPGYLYFDAGLLAAKSVLRTGWE